MKSDIKKFNVGDLIYNKKDDILFLIVRVSHAYVELQPNDKKQNRNHHIFSIKKWKMREQLSEYPEVFDYYTVVK